MVISTREISEAHDPQNFGLHAEVARRGGTVARQARERLNLETGKPVVTQLNAKKVLQVEEKEE